MNAERNRSLVELNTAQKIKQIVDSPFLPVLVETMSSNSLLELVDQIGLEDSHAIVQYASDKQIKGMLDIQLWQREPGQPEVLLVDDFYPWLEIWNDMGEEFVSNKLIALGEEFVALCFTKHLLVADTRVIGIQFPDQDFGTPGRDFGNYDVIPRPAEQSAKGEESEIDNEEIWFTLSDTLHHLHSASPDFLESVLRRCSFVRSILREDISEHHVAEDLQRDLGQQRDEKAEKSGHVTVTDAFAFLSTSRNSPISDALSAIQYDGLTRRYFRLMESNQQSGMLETRVADQDHVGESDQPEPVLALKSLLVELGISDSNERKELLPPPDASKTNSDTPILDRTLTLLQQESDALFVTRREEILYLANVLALGTGMHGSPFTEVNAVKAVRATCNLGLEYLVQHQQTETDELYFEFLSAEPGMLRPFHVGFRLLNQVPRNCAIALAEFLSSKKLTRRLDRLPVIAAQLDHVWPGDQLLSKVEAGQFDELKGDIEILTLVLENVAVHCLDHLIDSFPVFPRIIAMNPTPVRLDKSIRFVASLGDLNLIQEYVDSLRIDI